jgi:hypothetical protein
MLALSGFIIGSEGLLNRQIINEIQQINTSKIEYT